MGSSLWLRWSARDLRRRWPLVLAIALLIALGTGMYTGLGSMSSWRTKSNDASFALVRTHDLRLDLTQGSYLPQGRLERAVRGIPSAASVAAAQERLIAATQVDASRRDEAILVPGRIVGVQPGSGGRGVDDVFIEGGRGLRASDAGRPVAVMEANFADAYDLPATGTLRVAGGQRVRWVGQGREPQYFLVTTGGAQFGGEGQFAVLFAPLATAQRLAGRPGEVNQVVVRVGGGADVAAVEREVRRALRREFPQVGFTVTRKEDEAAHRVLYRDARNDQELYNVFALLLLAGSAFAAFNLISRVVEAQRREIGVGMALGVAPRALALRPMLMGAQIALLGVVLGVVVGYVVGGLLSGVLEDLLPLPVITTPFEVSIFARGALLGLALPLLATAYPVWRGVRVPPIEAIRIGFRSAGRGGLAPLLRRVPVPGRTLAQMPARNVLRAPRRTLMTVLGIGAVIAVVVSLNGLIDSFAETIDRTESALEGDTPSRIEADLDAFHPRRSEVVRGVAGARAVGAAEPGLKLQGTVGAHGEDVDVVIGILDPGDRLWQPTVVEGRAPGDGEILLAQEAARDLGVDVGDRVEVVRPRRTGPDTFRRERRTLRVSGLHPNPFRFLAYAGPSEARAAGLAGTANTVSVVPAPGSDADDVKRGLFGRSGVASVQPVSAPVDSFRERLEQFFSVLRIAELVALLIALLIAFNSNSINMDERAREHATMFAFGVPVRSATALAAAEGLIVGVLGTLVGLALGVAVLSWVVNSSVQDTLPELGAVVSLSALSIASAFLLGVVAVTAAPLLGARRLRRMDVPSTLRVVE